MTAKIGLLKVVFIALMTLQICTANDLQAEAASSTKFQKIEPRDTNVIYASGMCLGIWGTTAIMTQKSSPLASLIGKGLILSGTVIVGYDLVSKGAFLFHTLYEKYAKKSPIPENKMSLIESTYTNFIMNLSISALLCLIYSEGKTILEVGLSAR